MSRKIYLSFLAIAITLGAVVFGIGHSAGRAARPASLTVAALPPSEFVVFVDAQRALNETLPGILASNPAALAKLNAKLDEFEKETGINPRSFQSIAVGGRSVAGRPNDYSAVVLLSGDFKAADLIEAGFAAAKKRGEIRREEQQYEGRTIFVLSDPQRPKTAGQNNNKPAQATTSTQPNLPAASTATPGQYDVKLEAKVMKMAVTAIDERTIAVGNLEDVRAAIDANLGRVHVDDQLVQLATSSPNAIVGFSGKMPADIGRRFGVDKTDMIGKHIAAIQRFYGSFSSIGTDTESFVGLQTETADQARDLSQTLNTMKTLGGIGLGRDAAGMGSLGEVIKALSITAQNNEIQIKLRIPQASFAPLIRHF
ncbi:MAG TPA: hypothetical protein VF723_00100 [Pyrinomonadaceae bacterium]|jgi:hypothetical protein